MSNEGFASGVTEDGRKKVRIGRGGGEEEEEEEKEGWEDDGAEDSDIEGRLLKRIRKLKEEKRKEKEERLKAEESARKAEESARKAEEEKKKEKEERLKAEESARKAEESARKAEEIARKAEEERLKAEEKSRREQGHYYTNIEQVWVPTTMNFTNPRWFDEVRRREAPIFTSPDGVEYYKETLESARKEAAAASQFVPPVASTARGSSRSSFPRTNKIWSVNIFGDTRVNTMQRAHLVPHSDDASTLYFDVAIWALGLDDDKWDTIQRVIHGTATGSKNRRIAHTGIKHSVPNMICLAHQGEYLDRIPCLLVIPILTLEEVKSWKGGKYDALVMAGEYTEIDKETKALKGPVASFSRICKDVGMTNEGDDALPGQIEVGRKLLSDIVCGMAYSLIRRLPKNKKYLTDAQKKKLETYTRSELPANAEVVLVPATNPSPRGPVRVRVVNFRGATDPDNDTTKKQHPAPDPLLLAVRAAVNWSRRHAQQLLAAAEPPPDIFEQDELYQLAMEEYLDKVDRALRPPDDDPEEFARRLGQSTNGGGDGGDDDDDDDDGNSSIASINSDQWSVTPSPPRLTGHD